MRHDIKKKLPDGVHKYGDFAKYHVWFGGCYIASFASELDADNKLRSLKKQKPIAKATKPDGVHHEAFSGYWSVWYKQLFYGSFKFKVSAQAKYKHVRAAG